MGKLSRTPSFNISSIFIIIGRHLPEWCDWRKRSIIDDRSCLLFPSSQQNTIRLKGVREMNNRYTIYYVPPYCIIAPRIHVPGHWVFDTINGPSMWFGARRDAIQAKVELLRKFAAAKKPNLTKILLHRNQLT